MTNKEKLKEAGYPEEIVVLDFETYYDSDFSLRKLNTYQFIRDDRFEITGLGVDDKFIHGPNMSRAMVGLRRKYGKELEDVTVVVANASFDILVLKEKFGFVPKYIIDIQDLSRHIDTREKHHSVEKMAERYHLANKGDTSQFKDLRYKDMTADQLNALKSYCLNDCMLERNLFRILFKELTNATQELKLMRHTLDLYLHPRITFDFELAEHLSTEFDKLLAIEIAPCGLLKEEVSKNISFLEHMTDALAPEETVAYKQGKKGMVPCFAKTDEAFQNYLTHDKVEVRNLANARVAVKGWPSKTGRIKRMKDICDGLYLPGSLRYYSGHTGRWGGCMKTNLQNLASRSATELILRMRALLTVQPGQNFIICDSGQIECRMLAWLAGELDLLEGFANEDDVYCQFATDVFQFPVRKGKKSDPRIVRDMCNMRRNFGKMGILASGFGMGPDTLFVRCLGDPGLKPYFDSGEYDLDFVKAMTKTYRSKYTKIVKFWREIESAFKFVVKFEGNIASITDYGKFIPDEQPDARLTLWCKDRMACIKLPSGRILYYPESRVAGRQLSYKHTPLWGGLLAENLCQSIARDLLAHWLLRCEEEGLPIVLHVHDELIGLTDSQYAQAAVELIESIMLEGPAWSEGLPLSVGDGAIITTEYTK